MNRFSTRSVSALVNHLAPRRALRVDAGVAFFAACSALGLLACEGEPELVEISSNEAALTASANSERALEGMLDSVDFLTASSSMAGAFSLMGGQSETCDVSSSCSSDGVCEPDIVVCESTGEVDLEEARQDLRDEVAELVRTLRERIFIEENLESETETTVTYLLGPDVLCDEEDAPGFTAGGLDSACADRAARLQPRLQLTSPRAGDIDVTLLLGEERNAPLTLHLYSRSLGVQVDLGEALGVARELGEDLGNLRELDGVIELALVENAARDYSIELRVLEALHVLVADGDEQVSASLARSVPALSLRADGNEQRLTASVDLGTFQMQGPFALFAEMFGGEPESGDFVGLPAPDGSGQLPEPTPAPEREYHGTLDIFLAGLSGTMSYVAGQDVLDITNLGLGDATSRIALDGNTLLGIDMNAAHGRRVNVVVEPRAEGEGATVKVEPSFELAVELAFHNIADQIDDIAEYLLDNTIRVAFEGDAPTLEMSDEAVRVASGTLALETTNAPADDVMVVAGQCLVEVESELETENESSPFAELEAAVCE